MVGFIRPDSFLKLVYEEVHQWTREGSGACSSLARVSAIPVPVTATELPQGAGQVRAALRTPKDLL
jgi:hypothetical protein